MMAELQRSSAPEDQARLMVWTIPRSLSTVLIKCLASVNNTKVFFEQYTSVHFTIPGECTDNTELGQKFAAGCEKIKEAVGFDVPKLTFRSVKEQLEKSYVGKKFILGKDMAFAVNDRLEFLPKGYRHLFLVRHPLKVFPSWKRLYQQLIPDLSPDKFRLDDLPKNNFPNGFGYKEISELLDYVKEELDPEAIIIDADDLLQDPKSILSAVFKVIGLPFDEKILHWEAADAVTQQWIFPVGFLEANQFVGQYQTALGSTCFLKPRPLPDRLSVSPDLLALVDASMPYYEKMYNKRLTGKD